jgi:hypothetical protein
MINKIPQMDIEELLEHRERENQKLQAQLSEANEALLKASKAVVKYCEQLNEANKVIEFYSNVTNPIVGDNEQVIGTEDMDNYYEHGGKRARKYLEKYKVVGNE